MMMKKYIIDFDVKDVQRVGERHALLRLCRNDGEPLPPMAPGQFAEVRIDGEPRAFLRRPISLCDVDYERGELWLLVAAVGAGTRRLAALHAGEKLNCVLPLGNGFTLPKASSAMRTLLVGGGTGTAPLLFLGRKLRECGNMPTFLLGAKTESQLLLTDRFRLYGDVCLSTEDGSAGCRGFVTDNSVLQSATSGNAKAGGCPSCDGGTITSPRPLFDRIYACGPTPMMIAVARYARQNGISCQVSLENTMACGIGACLCCIQPTVSGNRRVCADGPVFNIDDLLWT